MVQYACPGGGEAPGYLSVPDAGAEQAPGVVVLQEWWGLNDQICGVADRLSGAGYRALVPDLFRGRVTSDPDEAHHMMSGLDWRGATSEDLRGAVQFLKDNGRKVAVMGFCMGGALSVMAAEQVPELDVAVCFYGIPPAEVADPTKLRAPILFHFAQHDDWCTPDAVHALEGQVIDSGVGFEIYRYDAQHGFFNEERPAVYEPVAARKAWRRSLQWIQHHI